MVGGPAQLRPANVSPPELDDTVPPALASTDYSSRMDPKSHDTDCRRGPGA